MVRSYSTKAFRKNAFYSSDARTQVHVDDRSTVWTAWSFNCGLPMSVCTLSAFSGTMFNMNGSQEHQTFVLASLMSLTEPARRLNHTRRVAFSSNEPPRRSSFESASTRLVADPIPRAQNLNSSSSQKIRKLVNKQAGAARYNSSDSLIGRAIMSYCRRLSGSSVKPMVRRR